MKSIHISRINSLRKKKDVNLSRCRNYSILREVRKGYTVLSVKIDYNFFLLRKYTTEKEDEMIIIVPKESKKDSSLSDLFTKRSDIITFMNINVDNSFAEKYNRAFQKALDYDAKTLSAFFVEEEMPEIKEWFEQEDKLTAKNKRKDTISYKKMRKVVKEFIQDKKREKWSESRRKELRLSILEALKAVRTLMDNDLIHSLLRLLVNKHTAPRKNKKQKIEILAFALLHSLPVYMKTHPDYNLDYLKDGTLLPSTLLGYTEIGKKWLIRLLIQIMPCFLFKEISYAQNIFYSFPSVILEAEEGEFKASDSLREEEFSFFMQQIITKKKSKVKEIKENNDLINEK